MSVCVASRDVSKKRVDDHLFCAHERLHPPSTGRISTKTYPASFFVGTSWLWDNLRAKASGTRASAFRDHDLVLAKQSSKPVIVGIRDGLFNRKPLSDCLKSKGTDLQKFCETMNEVMNKKCECAGYVLGNAKTKLMDELCVINEGPTFEETDRLGVVPVDLTDDRRFFSQSTQTTKLQMVSFHSHPLVIKPVLGRHAPPSYEDGACFLSTLKHSEYHAIFGYSGVYVLQKLGGNHWNHERTERAVAEFTATVCHNAADDVLRERTKEMVRLQSGLNGAADVSELSFLRRMSFDTLEDIQEYMLAYMYMFRMRLAVDYYPYEFA
ncbi:hypothetical protein CYMTET_6682 [Cymbomonas tetramitiformis]|uniref:Uncharacterized protein n=1 Tax=Cymbomonas tetramitiformis TaxID=36881 RepID=A0AAE0LHN0_9CHLO|nr:hypothetical protein CYMTET_6682 [Cymbomonas tetramitiformis]